MLFIDKYAYCSKLQHVNPMEKFCFAAATMMICLAANSNIVSLLTILIMAGIVIFRGGIPYLFYFKLLLVPFGFLIMGVATIAFNVIHDIDTMVWGISVFDSMIGFTRQSLQLAVNICLKSMGVVSCLYFLSLTTPLLDIITLLRKLKFPGLFLELMSLIYRFIFVLMEMANKIMISQSSRLGYSSIKNGYISLGQLISSLFIRSYKHSQDLYTALEARCYSGELRIIEKQHPYSIKNLVMIVLFESFLITAAIVFGGN